MRSILSRPIAAYGAFHLQQIHSVPVVKLIRKLGDLMADELDTIRQKLRQKLSLP